MLFLDRKELRMNRKRRKRKKACDLKSSHKTKYDAIKAIHKTLEKHFIFHRMNAYKCTYCGMWHIGRSSDILYHRFDELVKHV